MAAGSNDDFSFIFRRHLQHNINAHSLFSFDNIFIHSFCYNLFLHRLVRAGAYSSTFGSLIAGLTLRGRQAITTSLHLHVFGGWGRPAEKTEGMQTLHKKPVCWELNLWPTGYEAGVLTTLPPRTPRILFIKVLQIHSSYYDFWVLTLNIIVSSFLSTQKQQLLDIISALKWHL